MGFIYDTKGSNVSKNGGTDTGLNKVDSTNRIAPSPAATTANSTLPAQQKAAAPDTTQWHAQGAPHASELEAQRRVFFGIHPAHSQVHGQHLQPKAGGD